MTEHQGNVLQAILVFVASLNALSFDQWISLCVVITGVLTFATNLYYRRKEFQHKQNLHIHKLNKQKETS